MHGNATEHIAEYAAGMVRRGMFPGSVNIATQAQLTSLRAAISEAESTGIIYGRMMNIGGWELKFAAPHQAGQLPAIIHALMH